MSNSASDDSAGDHDRMMMLIMAVILFLFMLGVTACVITCMIKFHVARVMLGVFVVVVVVVVAMERIVIHARQRKLQ